MTDLKVEVWISSRTENRARASMRIEMEGGGISISEVLIRDTGGRLRITFPLDRRQRPYVYLRGELKQAVYAAAEAAFAAQTGDAGA